jgi:DNA adenine methylase
MNMPAEKIPPPRRPVLRYHGGKWRLAPWIIGFFPPHKVYVEPYSGAASVLLRKPRSFAEVYNDLDRDVVNVFRILRDPVKAKRLAELCALTPWSRDEFLQSYEPVEDELEQARRTIVRGYMAYGSTSRRLGRTGFRAKAYRRNQTGAQDWTAWPAQVELFVERMRAVTIENRPALEVIAQQDSPETLFYVDPPYPQETRSSIRCAGDTERAYAHDMLAGDHRALAAVLHGVQGMVVLSGYACELYDQELFPDWQRHEREAMADAGQWRTEVIWLNEAAAKALKSGRAQRGMFDG